MKRQLYLGQNPDGPIQAFSIRNRLFALTTSVKETYDFCTKRRIAAE